MTKNSKSALVPEYSTPGYIKFLFGGFSGMGATLFVQPLDLVKNRMQLSGMNGKREYSSSIQAIRSIATYTTTRLGLYSWLFESFSREGKSPSFGLKAIIGMTSGGVASIIGNPMELALVRMTSDGRLPVNEQRNYRNVFDAVIRVVREEGILTLWRGCTPTVVRAMVVNSAQLATYSQAKQYFLSVGLNEGVQVHFCASMISGLATTTASMPVDIIKTRIQNMKVIDGKPEFYGISDVISRVIKNEGFFAFWKGFLPYYMRLGPHTVLTFIILEQLNVLYARLVHGKNAKQKSL